MPPGPDGPLAPIPRVPPSPDGPLAPGPLAPPGPGVPPSGPDPWLVPPVNAPDLIRPPSPGFNPAPVPAAPGGLWRPSPDVPPDWWSKTTRVAGRSGYRVFVNIGLQTIARSKPLNEAIGIAQSWLASQTSPKLGPYIALIFDQATKERVRRLERVIPIPSRRL